MYELKTKPTDISPLQVIAAVPSEKKRADAEALLALFQKVTGRPPVVWGGKYIGFGSYRYTYPSGHTGEAYTTGFAVSKAKITLHLYMEEAELHRYLKKLGKATAGKSCVYVNKLADIDTGVLADMIGAAVRFAQKAAAGGAS